MSGHKGRNELIVRNPDSGELEVIDMHTGELITSTAYKEDESAYVFNYKMALLICQEVAKGRTLLDIGNDPRFPPSHVINHWKRTQEMFAMELRLARKQQAEYHRDKVAEIADHAANLRYSTREDIANAKLASDQYKWLAEKGDPENYGNKVTHEGSTEKPITMRVINTGINRALPDVVVKTKEVHDEQRKIDDEAIDGNEREADEEAGRVGDETEEHSSDGRNQRPDQQET